MKYNWQQSDWPKFKYELAQSQETIIKFAEKLGKVSGSLQALPATTQTEVLVDMLVQEAIKTSEIEGEYIDRKDVNSSIKNRLGLSLTPEKVHDKRAKSIASLMLEMRNTFQRSLTQEMLFDWHKMLFSYPMAWRKISIGKWREHDEPMQIVSGRFEKLKIHFEAPPSKAVSKEMKAFIKWFNDTAPNKPGEIKAALVRAAIAHLYFESIHPFEDGNGRIGRIIAEKALSQSLGQPALISVSSYLEANKKNYYKSLQIAQSSNEITPWINYFAQVILNAQQETEEKVNFVLKKAKFFDEFQGQLNSRQEKMLQRMLQEGPNSFEGGMSAKKYMAITKTSKATATRDLQSLKKMGAIKKTGEGRSVRYNIVLPR